MRNRFPRLLWAAFLLLLLVKLPAQLPDTAISSSFNVLDRFTEKGFKAIEKKYAAIEKRLQRSTSKKLKRFQSSTEKLQKKLSAKDSLGAVNLLSGAKTKYEQLQMRLNNVAGGLGKSVMKEYLPGMDSVQTAFRFLDKAGITLPGMSSEKLAALQSLNGRLRSLQDKVNISSDIQSYLKEQRNQWKALLGKFSMGKELQSLNKQVYYYQQQFNAYKALLNDPDKLTQKALDLLKQTPAFTQFMQNNSQLAQLFRIPGSGSTSQGNGTPIPGLQTRSMVQQQLGAQLGNSNVNPQQYIQQQVQAAKSELDKLKDKINAMGGGDSDMEMPAFKPNHQKSKTFWKRLEYGLNIQSQRPNGLLPVASDLALTVGYQLNDKNIIGIGASYKLGWGKKISAIRFTSEGVGLRSFIDIKLKGSIWISGGYELNYQQAFKSIEVLKDMNAWQRSGLLGLSKKYKIGKKGGNLQLLWDMLSYSQVPRTQPLKFRIGYTL